MFKLAKRAGTQLHSITNTEHKSMQHDSQAPVTLWLREFENGDDDAAANLWQFYFQHITIVAEHRIRNVPKGGIEAEDIAASVFESLWRGANEGRFREIASRDNLWYLVLKLIKQKVANFLIYVEGLRKNCAYKPHQIAAFDETAVWVDCIQERTIEDTGTKRVAIFSSGNHKSKFTVSLAARADGRKLKPMITFKGKSSKRFPMPFEAYAKLIDTGHSTMVKHTWEFISAAGFSLSPIISEGIVLFLDIFRNGVNVSDGVPSRDSNNRHPC